MATEFSPAPKEAVGLVERLCASHGLGDLNIGVLMRDTAAVSKGREVYAKVYRPPSWTAAFDLDYDLIVELPLDKWAGFNRHQREALVDYALCHATNEYDDAKDKFVVSLRAPDIQGFASNIRKYGLWWPQSDQADSAFEQARQVELPGLARKGKVEAVPTGALQAATEGA